MKIQIELQGRLLEVAHIGTPEWIATQIALERAFISAADIGKSLADTIDRMGEAAKEAGRQLVAFLQTPAGQRFALIAGSGVAPSAVGSSLRAWERAEANKRREEGS
ncbi:hypothetical protein M0R72_11935 [Candidatus Pacearchaeota archaeon]|jgi:hypothetical protein|nr:hypothetical protein [Candidatus Pacearchaeota archaeon]